MVTKKKRRRRGGGGGGGEEAKHARWRLTRNENHFNDRRDDVHHQRRQDVVDSPTASVDSPAQGSGLAVEVKRQVELVQVEEDLLISDDDARAQVYLEVWYV